MEHRTSIRIRDTRRTNGPWTMEARRLRNHLELGFLFVAVCALWALVLITAITLSA